MNLYLKDAFMGNIEICPACNRGFGLFRWRYNCDFCNRVYCSDCLRKPTFQKLTNSPIKIADYCPQCWDSIAQPAIAQYEKALTNYSKVEIFSCKYKGHIPRDMSFTPIQLKTDFFSDRDNAENALKTDAAFLNELMMLVGKYNIVGFENLVQKVKDLTSQGFSFNFSTYRN